MSRESEHTCHARCEVRVPPAMLMCRRHWRMVPHKLQRAVWSAYQDGQERLAPGGPRPSRQYLEAAQAAIDFVNDIIDRAAAATAPPPPSLFDT